MQLPNDYAERVYSGLLGKIIGVYLGRPFEGWSYERIISELGEINYYVHERFNQPLIVTDDDISGTLTFLRALPDHGNTLTLSSNQIGKTWLNYLIEGRTILWWGGIGNSTEHTAYVNLKNGISAPRSGSAVVNGKIVSEQIGAQIFIDGWAMVAPGDPELAADFAKRAGCVSHDGEAIYAAQVIAAMEAQAFVEKDIDKLIDTAVSLIPNTSLVSQLIYDIREWHAKESDWRKTRLQIVDKYGYHNYGGNCHVIPNHALIIHSLLHGEDDFQKSMLIVNTSGWDTDCNSGNVGCLLGIKNGLDVFDGGPDWRGPVRDRLYLPTADSGRSITDAVQEANYIINIGRALHGKKPIYPKAKARYHFEFPGSVQGFIPEENERKGSSVSVENVEGHSLSGKRSLAIQFTNISAQNPARVSTITFTPLEALSMHEYDLLASPTINPGQIVKARLSSDREINTEISCQLFIRYYGEGDNLVIVPGEESNFDPGDSKQMEWRIPSLGGAPIAEIGIEIKANSSLSGNVYLDYLTWNGEPEVELSRPYDSGDMWRRAWVDAVDRYDWTWDNSNYRLIQNEGRGLLLYGTRDWKNYKVSADVTPHLACTVGIAARVQGMKRYYALCITQEGKGKLIKVFDEEIVLNEVNIDWVLGQTYDLALEISDNRLTGWINGSELLHAKDASNILEDGGIALVCERGRTETNKVTITPVGK